MADRRVERRAKKHARGKRKLDCMITYRIFRTFGTDGFFIN
jgi:hypothetical protein